MHGSRTEGDEAHPLVFAELSIKALGMGRALQETGESGIPAYLRATSLPVSQCHPHGVLRMLLRWIRDPHTEMSFRMEHEGED